MEGFSYTNAVLLKVNELRTDYSYQRPLDMKRAKKIANEFSEDLFGIITVSKRNDGGFYIIDGNTRVAAARIYGKDRVLCRIIYGLDQSQEADIFGRLNKTQKSVSGNEQLRADITAGKAEAVAYKRILDLSGVKYTFMNSNGGNGDPKTFVAHSTGRDIMKKHGQERLLQTLRIVNESGHPLQGWLVVGVAVFLSCTKVDQNRLLAVLKRTPFSELQNKSSGLKESIEGGMKNGKATAMAIAGIYNKGFRGERIEGKDIL